MRSGRRIVAGPTLSSVFEPTRTSSRSRHDFAAQSSYGGSPPLPVPPPPVPVYPPVPITPVQRTDPVVGLPGPPAVPDLPIVPPTPDYQSSINDCAEVFETFASNREHRKYAKLFRKIAQGLRQIQHHDIDKDMLNELYPSLNRLNQAVTYSFDCAQSPISSDFYEFLSSRINEDDQDDDSRGRGRGRGRGRNQLTKIQNLIGAASECLEDYCGS
ncbi:hypothetical protein Y032_0081g1448 [Ancylostoma ceylanicum]|uniref:Uncharacterized protein n=1 Tax=Ancylostoma ceylanicum TaxID=53326 RepID=A0A016TS66_9BILA|nr:hypothetical protein Y032_0081g1448 [Ancylostoma ceylanicum]